MRSGNCIILCVLCSLFAITSAGIAMAQDSRAGLTNASASTVTRQGELPDSPGVVWAQSQSSSQNPAPAQSSNAASPSTQQTVPPAPQTIVPDPNATPDQKLQRPLGTAAAEAPPVSGITAAQPSGVAIAPGKQRRVRSIVLKVGAMIAAGAAVGAVIALSEATPSKPPGAH